MGQLVMQVAGVVQVATACFAFFGEHLLDVLGVQRTPLLQSILENKLQVLGFSFLLNSVAQSAAKTDAFEVYVNGEQIFSKLEKKRMPTIEEIYQGLADRGVSVGTHGGLAKSSSSRQM